MQDVIHGEAAFLGMLLGAAMLSRDRARRWAAGGVVAFGVALAATRVGQRDSADVVTSADAVGFEVVNAGLLVLGILAAVTAIVRSEFPASAGRQWVGPVLLAVSVAAAVRSAGALLAVAGPFRAVATGLGLGVAAVALASIGRWLRLGAAVRWLDRQLLGRPVAPSRVLTETTARRRTAFAGLAGALAVAAGAHVAVVFLGAVVAAWAGYFALRAAGIARVAPVLPAVVFLLIPTYWLLATIAGPVGLSLSSLPMLPLSPAAELLLAAMLLAVCWAFAGLWPLHGQTPGVLLAPVGVLLLARVGLPALPAGMEHWRALAMPVLLLGIWHAALVERGRSPLLAVGGALLGLVTLTPEGRVGAAWLLGAALGLQLVDPHSGDDRSLLRVVRRAGWVAAGWGGLHALEGGFRTEVVYTVLAVAGAAHAITASEARSLDAR
ncbi:MAG: hypothetical protein ACREMX_11300 [Gemmatimonadales bacterium]